MELHIKILLFWKLKLGAGCGDWTDANSAETLRPCQNDDVAKIKGEEGDPNTCTRCSGKVNYFYFYLFPNDVDMGHSIHT